MMADIKKNADCHGVNIGPIKSINKKFKKIRQMVYTPELSKISYRPFKPR